MRSHESGRPHKCNSCHLTFELEADLLAHIPRHRETKHTKIHICNICGKSYNQELYLTKHVQAKHAERIQGQRASCDTLPSSGGPSAGSAPPSTRSRTKQLSKQSEPSRPAPASPSPSSNSSSSKSNLVSNLVPKSKKLSNSLSSPSLLACLPAQTAPQPPPQQTSTPSHINAQYSWNRSTGGTSSPDSVNSSVNSSNCMSSTASTEMISLTNCLSNSTSGQQDAMFTDLSGSTTLPSRYEQSSMDLFYNHPNSMTPNGQHQSAFTALGRSSSHSSSHSSSQSLSHSPKYFTNTCESGFVFSKPQYSPVSGNQPLNGQLHSASTNQQHSLSPGNQHLSHNGQLTHNSSALPDNQLLQQSSPNQGQQSLQMHQLSPLNGHMPIQSSINNQSLLNNSIGSISSSNQTSTVSQLHHLQHGQTTGQSASQHHPQLIALNQIRNYACSPTSIPQPQPTANHHHHHHHSSPFVNNIFLNAQNSSMQSMSSCNLNDYPIMILQ